MPNVDKRVNYYDGLFLRAKDFTDEQDYHIDRQRNLARLFRPGIVSGLGVTATGASQVEVAPGTAIDAEGRQIVLAQSRSLPLSGFAGKTVLILISYREEASDPAAAGVTAETRWHERPVVEAVPEPVPGASGPDTHPRLARLVIGPTGNVAGQDASVRTFAATQLGKEATLEKLTLSRPSTPAAQWPSLTCGDTRQVEVDGSLRVTGRLTIEDPAVPLLLRETGQAVTAGGLWRMPLDGGVMRFDANTSPKGDFSPYNTVLWLNADGNCQTSGSLTLRNFKPDGARVIWASEGSPDWRARNFGNLDFFPGEGQPAALSLATNGNVGVGARPQNARLDVRGADCVVQVRSSIPALVKGTVNGGAIYFGVENGNNPNSATAAIETSWGPDPVGAPNPELAIGITRDFNTGKTPSMLMDYNGNINLRQGTTSRAFVQAATGHFGVGTAAPADRLHVSGGNIRIDAGTDREVFFTDNGQIRSADDHHRILFRRAENKLELREYGEIIFSPGSRTGETATVVMRGDGSVDVKGDLRVAGNIPQAGWVAPTPRNNWANYPGGGYNPLGYQRNQMGTVTLRGLIQGGTLSDSNSVIFQLPDGYRPARRQLFGAIRQVGPNDAPTLVRVDVLTTGEVMLMAGPIPIWLSLDGLTFRAAPPTVVIDPGGGGDVIVLAREEAPRGVAGTRPAKAPKPKPPSPSRRAGKAKGGAKKR